MEKKYQIFISSTYTDLTKAREKVRDAILTMMHFPVGMEMFSAGNEEQWEIIRDTIDSSDYYVLIVGRRYGSVIETGDDAGISYTEKEFRYAKEKEIPILAFILSDDATVKMADFENDPKKMERLAAFKKDVENGRMVEWWKTPDELAFKVTVALHKQMQRAERPGWIRGDSLETNRKSVMSKTDNSKIHYTEIPRSNAVEQSQRENNESMMKDKNYYINLTVDLIVGDTRPDLPRDCQNPIIDEDMLLDFAVKLYDQYPDAVQQSIWIPMNLRKVIDSILDDCDSFVKRMVFDDCFFSESDRQKILGQCAEIIRKKLQRRIGVHLKVCYKIMPNGKVGYRLE